VDSSYLLHQMRIAFFLGFTLLAVWLVVKWVRHAQATAFTVRDWLGAFGFWLGILSSSVLGYSYAHFWVTHKLLVAGGLGLWHLLEFGSLTAVGGLLFGFAGRGWVRRAAVFVSVVAAFQWANLDFPITDRVTTETMLATLAAGTLLWFGIHMWIARFGPREKQRNPPADFARRA
jgi:hypothetical protein